MARSVIVKVLNNTGYTIAGGTAVYQTGYDNAQNLVTIAPASYESLSTMPAIGVVRESILAGAEGVVKKTGLIGNINTSNVSVNTAVFVGHNGQLIFRDPIDINDYYYAQQLGTVTRVGLTDGLIDLMPLEIRPKIKHEELLDVLDEQHQNLVTAINVGGGAGVFDKINNQAISFKTIVGGDKITIDTLSDRIRINDSSLVDFTGNAIGGQIAVWTDNDTITGYSGLSWNNINKALVLAEGSSPTLTPGYGKIFIKASDSKLYFMDDSGSEYNLLAASSSVGVSELTFQQNKNFWNEAIHHLVVAADGYSGGTGTVGVSELTFQQNKNFWNEAIYQLTVAADGYSSGPTGVSELTFQQNKAYWDNAIYQLTVAADGYSDKVSELTFQQNKNFWNEAIYQLTVAADAYGSGTTGVSELTFQQNKNFWNEAIYQLTVAADAYGGASGLSSGVAGAVQFSDGASGFSSDDTNFHWDDTNNYLGIRTNSPQRPLHIIGPDGALAALPIFGARDVLVIENNGNANITIFSSNTATASSLKFADNDSGQSGEMRYNHSTDELTFWTSTNQAAVINSSGQVGIGTALPNELLTIDGVISLIENTTPSADTGYGKIYPKSDGKLYFLNGSSVEYDLTATGTSGVSELTFQQNKNFWNEAIYQLTVAADAYGGASGLSSGVAGAVQFSDGASGFSSDDANFHWDDTNNRLGIGTVSPTHALDVIGDISIAGAIYNHDLSETIQVIRQALDGYGAGSVPEITFQQNKAYWDEAIYQLRAAADGYAVIGTGGTASGVSGAVQFSNGSGVFLSDNANFHWDDSNNRLGIGTASPSYALEIVGEVASSSNGRFGSVALWSQSGSSRFGLKYGSAGQTGDANIIMLCNREAHGAVAIATDNGASGGTGEVERIRISAGTETLVGIGTSSPIEALTINGIVALQEQGSTPATQDGYGKVYVKTDNELYYLGGLGLETNISAEYSITASKTTTYTASMGELVRCDPSGGGFVVTLPNASDGVGHVVVVKNTTSSTNIITIQGTGGEQIDGLASVTIESGYEALTLISYGSEWGRI